MASINLASQHLNPPMKQTSSSYSTRSIESRRFFPRTVVNISLEDDSPKRMWGCSRRLYDSILYIMGILSVILGRLGRGILRFISGSIFLVLASLSGSFADIFSLRWFRWMRKLYWTNAAFSETTNFDHIKTHYYWSHTSVSVVLLHVLWILFHF